MTPLQHESIDRICSLDGVRIWIKKKSESDRRHCCRSHRSNDLGDGITRYVETAAANTASTEGERVVTATSAVAQVQQATTQLNAYVQAQKEQPAGYAVQL